MQEKISLCDINFHPNSFVDPRVRLFRYKGEIYRGISGEKAIFFKRLFQEGLIQRLIKNGLLIESELTSLILEEYDLVIRHRLLPFNSYPNEWCPAMLKDAMLTMLNLAIELAKHGLTLVDAHPWNLLFDLENNRTVFIDLGSIIPIDSYKWSAYNEFCQFCLYPLILMTDEYDAIARLLMFEDRGVVKSDVIKLVGKNRLLQTSLQSILLNDFYPKSLRKIKKLYYYPYRQNQNIFSSLSTFFNKKNTSTLAIEQNIRKKSHLKFLENIRGEVENIKINFNKNIFFGVEKTSSFSPQDSWNKKQRNIHQILTELKPTSVVDISCPPGWYAQLAAVLGIKVVTFDTDTSRTTQLYYDACNRKLPMLPLIMDFTKPTPARGLGNHWSIAATERLCCEMILALGIVHHLVGERHLNFNQIVKGLALLTQRWVLIEFIPSEDQEFSPGWSEKFYWYSLDNFIKEINQEFQQVRIFPSHPEHRVLLLCENNSLKRGNE